MKERIIQAAKIFLQDKSNVRSVARRLGCSKSTIHKDLSERLIMLDNELYKEVSLLLETNKQEKHIRGGNSTKEKFKKLKEL